MATQTRIYRVTIGASDRLVRTTSPASALMHVARDIASVGVASQDDLVECLQDGIKVETPAQEPEATSPSKPAQSALADPAPVDNGAPLFEGLDDADEDEGLEMHSVEEETPVATPSPVWRAIAHRDAKYRNPATGDTWSGRGLKPRWLTQALEDGRPLAEFEVRPKAEVTA